MKVPIITVGKYRGTPIDKLPNSYLRWMVNQNNFPKEWLEFAEKKLKESKYGDLYICVSRHAIDMYSVRFLDRWKKHIDLKKENADGLGTFIANEAEIAWNEGKDISKHRHEDDGIVKEYDGVVWVFGINKYCPDYKDIITVMNP